MLNEQNANTNNLNLNTKFTLARFLVLLHRCPSVDNEGVSPFRLRRLPSYSMLAVTMGLIPIVDKDTKIQTSLFLH